MDGMVLVKSKTNLKMKMNLGHRKRLKAGGQLGRAQLPVPWQS
jgi:hypothetical protein